MIKFIVFSTLFILILTTSIVKNSTKELEDKIYLTNESLLFLENRSEDLKLENNYLSSSEKLLEYQQLYFDDLLKKKSVQEINTLEIYNEKIKIGELKILFKNDQ